jgi:hypothetical protein
LNPALRKAIFPVSRRTDITVATTLADFLFAAIAIAIAVSQAYILRSTAQGMRHVPSGESPRTTPSPRAGNTLEWVYAIAPAVALVVLLAAVWLAMHPQALDVQGVAPGVGAKL